MKLKGAVLSVLLLLAAVARAQQSCQPPALAISNPPNMFSDEQEMELGDVIAEHLAGSIKVIEDEELAQPLHDIGDRVARQLPIRGLHLQFFLIEARYANAFSMPGGRVYVTRKLIATARSEDELAGGLGHELGHVVTSQPAQEVTRMWRTALDITSVGDRSDIEDKYHQFLESYRANPAVFRDASKRKEQEQSIADQVGLYSTATAGYRPQALADFFDRFTETKGKTGSWFSDLFGTTKPEGKRLREMAKNLVSLPPQCIDPQQRHGGRRESVHDLILRRELNPWLEGEVKQLKFSPDGRYLLAQDESSIFVLSRETHVP